MNCHPLVKLAYMIHRVCIAVVNGEGWLLESPGERGSFNTASLVTLLLVGESLAWGGPGPLPIVVIVFVVERCVWARGDCLRCARRNFLFKSFISRCIACSSSRIWDM